jgi:hypothetical protein
LLFEVSDEGKNGWIVFIMMTFDEKGQLFMVAASNKDDAHYDAIEKLITENKID